MGDWAKLARRAVALSFLSFSMLCVCSFGGPRNGWPSGALADKQNKNDVVYVCACLQTKSCSCMTMAKTGGFALADRREGHP